MLILLPVHQANKCSLTDNIYFMTSGKSRQAEREEDTGPLMALKCNNQSLEFILVFHALYFRNEKETLTL